MQTHERTKPGQKSWAHIKYFDKVCKVCKQQFKSPGPRNVTCSPECFDVNKREWKRNHNLKKYGLTIEEYEAKLKAQDGKCFICKKEQADEKDNRRLAVDHNHKTEKTRDLLCSRCNFIVGIIETASDLLEKCEAYVSKHG